MTNAPNDDLRNLAEKVGRKDNHQWVEFDETPIPEPADRLDAEWAEIRAKDSGPGSEIVRRVFTEQLRGWFDAFLLTAPTVEILTLCEMSQFMEREMWQGPQKEGECRIVEAFLSMLGLDPHSVLSSNMQRRPRTHA